MSSEWAREKAREIELTVHKAAAAYNPNGFPKLDELRALCFEQIASRLDELRDQARAEGREEAAKVAEAWHRPGVIVEAVARKSARDIAAAIRGLK